MPYNKLLVLAVVLPVLAACISADSASIKDVSDSRHNRLVLSNQSLEIGPDPVEFRTAGKAVILGGLTQVCVILRGDLSSTSFSEHRAEYDRLLDGAKLRVSVTSESGSAIELTAPFHSWLLDGAILERGELSACMNTPCGSCQPLIGTRIEKISVSSSEPLTVHGVYWNSRRDRR